MPASSEGISSDRLGAGAIEPVTAIKQSERQALNNKMGLAASPATPGDILTTLSSDSDEQIRLLVALNPSTPHHIVAKLAKDMSVCVRLGLAEDIHCPVEILTELAEDNDHSVRETARKTRRLLLNKHKLSM